MIGVGLNVDEGIRIHTEPKKKKTTTRQAI